MMRRCDDCGFLRAEGYEYPESYCGVGVRDDDPKFDEDNIGCGCRYNIRTLRRMERENEYAEYLYYLGYCDYSLMPTLEYTDENKAVLELFLIPLMEMLCVKTLAEIPDYLRYDTDKIVTPEPANT